jgi:macrolide-specific efflux system membrane fusion protein
MLGMEKKFKPRSFLLLLAFCFIGDIANAQYVEVPVRIDRIKLSVNSPGAVEPQNRLDIKPPIPGRIEEVMVEEGEIVKQGQKLAWMSSTERAALLDAARGRSRGELKKWEDYYKPTPILAPIAGMIILRNVEQGQSFTAQDVLFTLSDRLIIRARVDETDIAKVKLKQACDITLDAYPETKITGKVDKIAFDATTVNNVTTYTVDVLPDSIPEFMRSGMTTNIDFLLGQSDPVVLVPSSALNVKEGKTFVKKKDSSREGSTDLEIKTGRSEGEFVEVIAGLSQSDIVLVKQLGEAKKMATSPLATGVRRKR